MANTLGGEEADPQASGAGGCGGHLSRAHNPSLPTAESRTLPAPHNLLIKNKMISHAEILQVSRCCFLQSGH